MKKPRSNQPVETMSTTTTHTNNEVILKRDLDHLEITEDFHKNIPDKGWCRSMVEAMNFDARQQGFLMERAENSPDENDVSDMLEFFKLLDAENYHLEVNDVTSIEWNSMPADHIYEMITVYLFAFLFFDATTFFQ